MNDEIETIGFIEVDENYPKDKLLMYFPNDGSYVEILGHRIDFEGGYEEFVEHLKKLATYEEENKQLKKQYCERVDCMGRLGESRKVEELKASVKYYVDILTDLKKYVEECVGRNNNCVGAYSDGLRSAYENILTTIKELEDKYNEK